MGYGSRLAACPVHFGVHFEDNLMDICRSWQVVPARLENLVEAIHRGLKRRGKPSPRVS